MEEKQITLQIDGHFITVPEGSTILESVSIYLRCVIST